MFTDTHCHIHEASYHDADGALQRAVDHGIHRLICIGTDEVTSQEAVTYASHHDEVWATVGLHPHDASSGAGAVAKLDALIAADREAASAKIVAIGECGLDYFYTHSPKASQHEMLDAQLRLATKYNLPVSFHVRNAFDDFWPLLDSHPGVHGVLHSFTDSRDNLEKALERGFYIGVNGISTFTKDSAQLEMFASIPVNSLLFETDAPFLTPVPHRGMVNEPAFVTHIAHFIANLQAINLEELSRATERNATKLFFNTNTKP